MFSLQKIIPIADIKDFLNKQSYLYFIKKRSTTVIKRQVTVGDKTEYFIKVLHFKANLK